MLFKIIPLILACLLLGAHFLRDGHLLLAACCVVGPMLLLIRKRWVLLLVQWSAYLGGVVWLHTTWVLVRQRMMFGAPWIRMLLILLGVALFTFVAGYLLNSPRIRQRYR